MKRTVQRIQDEFKKFWAAVMAQKLIIAVMAMILYLPTGVIFALVLFNAFMGDFGLFVVAQIAFGVMTAAIVAVSLIKEKSTSLTAAALMIGCQLVLMIVTTGMAFSKLYQVSINLFTMIVGLALIVSQVALWWTVRHRDEVWLAVQAWLAKFFASQPAGNPAGSLNPPSSGGGNSGGSGGSLPSP